MKCAECNRLLTERAVAVKSKKVGGHTVVLESRQALVCDTHGVVAWDPARPYNMPIPYIPFVPYAPLPNTVPRWQQFPNTCGGASGIAGSTTIQKFTFSNTGAASNALDRP